MLTKRLETFDYMLLIVSLLLAVCFLISINSCSYANKKFGLKDDNVAEELVEDIILIKTGVSIDLSPDTPENQHL